MAEGPVSSNAADSDAADLDASAEELEVEDPGLRDLAICLTEHALQHESVSPDGQARASGSERVAGNEQSRRGSATAAAMKPEAVEAGNESAVMQPVDADAGHEMQLLEVSGKQGSLLPKCSDWQWLIDSALYIHLRLFSALWRHWHWPVLFIQRM